MLLKREKKNDFIMFQIFLFLLNKSIASTYTDFLRLVLDWACTNKVKFKSKENRFDFSINKCAAIIFNVNVI